MSTILLTTFIDANVETVFDAARSIDLHQRSARRTNEIAVAGRASGLIELGETTRWRARHFGLWLELEIRITEMDFPHRFTDEMIDGPFKSMRHVHGFDPVSGDRDRTRMTDIFEFAAPFGWLGRVVDRLVLKRYLTGFLLERNEFLKEYLEGNVMTTHR